MSQQEPGPLGGRGGRRDPDAARPPEPPRPRKGGGGPGRAEQVGETPAPAGDGAPPGPAPRPNGGDPARPHRPDKA